MSEEKYNKLSKDLGGKVYANQIIDDLNQEPCIICDVEKRRKCDSAYITLYNKLLKKYTKLQSELEDYKQLLSIYKSIFEDLKGGEYDDKRRDDYIK